MPVMHRCRAVGCARSVSHAMFMCQDHWRMVPPLLQGQIWLAWKTHDRLEHERAADKAIEFVRRLEEKNLSRGLVPSGGSQNPPPTQTLEAGPRELL